MANLSSSRKWSFWLCAFILGTALLLGHTVSAADAGRKVRQQVAPQYPPLARQFNATGIVKLSVEVTPGGEVKTMKVLGGHPLLIPAAEDAVRKWKYEPAKESSTEIVEIKFVSGQ
ncbi:MAG: energy transducer TonB [Terriglobia bacterium]|jgi:protein TonB|nr:energy transducer TonB [Terriglobia bacterium]